ncbi:MAG: GNAT family N-acetyltransferase [Dehalococcoidia bacterium]|nr:GNAT family N-acetyltransferase [Dehalococcoidia bacterium]
MPLWQRNHYQEIESYNMSYTPQNESGYYIFSGHNKSITRIIKLTKSATYDLKIYASAIAALADEIWHEYYVPIIGAAQVDYMLAKFQSADRICTDINNDGYIYLIALGEDESDMLGYCSIVPKENYMLLSKFYVNHDSRGKGIGRSLLNDVIKLCRCEHSFDKVRLTVNKQNAHAIAVYKKIGFTIVDSIKTDIGSGFFMDDFVMEHILPNSEF